MLALLDPEKKTAKNLIIKTLSETWPFSAKKLYNVLKKKHELGITYQAVYFALQELVQQSVLACQNRKYMLSPGWVEKISEFANELAERYVKHHYLRGQKRLQELNFRNVAEAWDFLLSKAETDFFGQSRIFYAYLRRLFPLPVSSAQIEKLKRFCSAHDTIILCAGNRAIEKVVAGVLRRLGAKVYLGIGCEQPANVIVVKDCVISIYFLYSQKDLSRFGNASNSEADKSRNAVAEMLKKGVLSAYASLPAKSVRVKVVIDRDPGVKANVLWAIQRLIPRRKSK